MRLAVIPARGGSKRIPRKNIKQFCGKPIIAWSIEAALHSDCFDEVIVSTDDDEIAAIAREYGATTPFIRPDKLSDDYTGTIPVIRHAIEWFNTNDATVTESCCIYATAPFVRTEDICAGLDTMLTTSSDYTFSVTSYPFPIQRAIKLTTDQHVEMFNPEYFNSRSQDLAEAYHDAGQFYWGQANAWLAEKAIFSAQSTSIILPRHRVQDIDTPEDWLRAELMFTTLNGST